MRILQVVHDYYPNYLAGTEVFTHDLAEELVKQGHEVMIFTVEPNTLIKDHLEIDRFNEGKVSVFKVHLRHFPERKILKRTLINHFLDERFEEAINEFQPDIVHVQHLINQSLTLIDVARRHKLPVVWHIHDLWFKCPTVNNFVGYMPCDCNKTRVSKMCANLVIDQPFSVDGVESKLLKNIMKLEWYLQRFQRNRIFRRYLRKVNKVIVPSNFLAKELIDFGVNSKKVQTIQHGINPPLKIEKKNIDKNKITFLFPSHLRLIKGFGEVVKAFEILQNDYSNYELLVAGVYNTKDDAINSLLDRLKKIKNAKYIGGYKPEERYEIYTQADVVLVPSQWNEIYGLVLDEALASDKFVIVSDKGALPERVVNEETGLIYNAVDNEELIKTIKIVLDNPEMVMNKKKSTSWRFFKDNVSDILDVYNHFVK